MEPPRRVNQRPQGFFSAASGMPPWVPRLLAQITALVILMWAAYHVSRALRGFLILLLISFFLSVALEPGVALLAKRGWRRGFATGCIFILAVLAVLLGVGLMVPLVVDQTQKLVDRVPGYIEQITEWLAQFNIQVSTEDLMESVTNIDASLSGFAGRIGGTLLGFGTVVVGTVFQMLTVALFTFYMTADAPRIRRAVLRVLPQERQRLLLQIQEIAVEKTGAYIYSRALLALVAGLITWVALRVIGVPFAAPLALWVGLLSQFVPVVGTYLGGILPVLIALLEDPVKAVWVIVFVALYQQFENYIIAPRITARTMSLHPAIAFGSAIVGATLMGAPGALMALPLAATVQAWISTYLERYELITSTAASDAAVASRGEQSSAPEAVESAPAESPPPVVAPVAADDAEPSRLSPSSGD